MSDREWSFYFPGQGYTPADAVPIVGHMADAESAAEQAADYDFNADPSDDAFDNPQEVIVVSPDGHESRWSCWCESTVTYHASPAEEKS